ncbi:MAG: phage tail protein, partial [Bacteroidales bacterium]|nr:phage tail protein [Bacteroidales bacterium]
MANIKGKQLMVFVKTDGETHGRTIAYATNHTLSLSSDLDDTGTKDDNDLYVNQEITGLDWSMTSENLIARDTEDVGAPTYKDLLAIVRAGTPVTVYFETVPGAMGKDREGTDWTSDANTGGTERYELLRGTALITSLELNAENKENVSYTVTFQGVGQPTIVEQVPTLAYTNVNDYPGCAFIVGDDSASELNLYFNLSVSKDNDFFTVNELYLEVYGENGDAVTGTVDLTAETGNVDFAWDTHCAMSSFAYTHKAN